MWNRSEQHGMGRRDMFSFSAVTVTTALAAIAAVNLPNAFLRRPWHFVSDGADTLHAAQATHPDDYSDFWASG
jgi:hypothetical protein